MDLSFGAKMYGSVLLKVFCYILNTLP